MGPITLGRAQHVEAQVDIEMLDGVPRRHHGGCTREMNHHIDLGEVLCPGFVVLGEVGGNYVRIASGIQTQPSHLEVACRGKVSTDLLSDATRGAGDEYLLFHIGQPVGSKTRWYRVRVLYAVASGLPLDDLIITSLWCA